MAHYDCSDCGASLGIAYGICQECTPEEVLQAKRDLNYTISKVRTKWDEIKEEEKEEYIDRWVKEEQKKYDKLFNKHKP